MRFKLLAALHHVVLADRTLHDSGNLKTIIQRKKLQDVLDAADCWYELPFKDKGREAIKNAIDMGRDAKEHTIYRIMLDDYFIYFIGTEDSISRKLDALQDEKQEQEQTKESKTAAPTTRMSEQTSPKMSD